MAKEWSVTFTDVDGRTRIGPWLLLDHPKQVDVILRWGRVPAREVADTQNSLDRWGVGSAYLRLTPNERLGLIARGRQCPWNGYELIRLRAAGQMPPRARFRTFR